MDTWHSFSGVKRPWREADHLPPFRGEVQNAWSYTLTPTYSFMLFLGITWGIIKKNNVFETLNSFKYASYLKIHPYLTANVTFPLKRPTE
jgi:hypothetical protein